jgi:SAM-dependent methyltransferase
LTSKDWQLWAKRPEDEMKCNVERIHGNLPDMESSKQLVQLISQVYEPGNTVLDVGCNVGHYLLGLRKEFPILDYTGVDAYEIYIKTAKEAFTDDSHAHFEIKDILNPIFTETPFDISYCCNVIIHLPDFRIPVKNLLSSTKKVCFIRTLFGDRTSIVKIPEKPIFDDEGNPLDYYYYNTWEKNYFSNFVAKLGWKTEFIKDKFNPDSIKKEYDTIKENKGTTIMNEKQVIGNIIANWEWAKLTPL